MHTDDEQMVYLIRYLILVNFIFNTVCCVLMCQRPTAQQDWSECNTISGHSYKYLRIDSKRVPVPDLNKT